MMPVSNEMYNNVPRNEFRGTVGGEWSFVGTVGGSSSPMQHDPVILQEEDTILILLYNYSGILRVTKGAGLDRNELRLAFDAMYLPTQEQLPPSAMATEQEFKEEPTNAPDDFDAAGKLDELLGTPKSPTQSDTLHSRKSRNRVSWSPFIRSVYESDESEEEEQESPNNSHRPNRGSLRIDHAGQVDLLPPNLDQTESFEKMEEQKKTNDLQAHLGKGGPQDGVLSPSQSSNVSWSDLSTLLPPNLDSDSDGGSQNDKVQEKINGSPKGTKRGILRNPAQRVESSQSTSDAPNVGEESLSSEDEDDKQMASNIQRRQLKGEPLAGILKSPYKKSSGKVAWRSLTQLDAEGNESEKGEDCGTAKVSKNQPVNGAPKPGILRTPMKSPKPMKMASKQVARAVQPPAMDDMSDISQTEVDFGTASSPPLNGESESEKDGPRRNSQEDTSQSTKGNEPGSSDNGEDSDSSHEIMEWMQKVDRQRVGTGTVDFSKLNKRGGSTASKGSDEKRGSGSKKSGGKPWESTDVRSQDVMNFNDSFVALSPRKRGPDPTSQRTSSATNYDDWDPEESDFVSPLHEACASPFATMTELQDTLTDYPTAVRKKDDDGRLPLHILAMNQELIFDGGDAGREMATDFAKDLIYKYPDSVLVEDNDGNVPFAAAVEKWIEWTYSENAKMMNITNTSMGAASFASRFASQFIMGRGATAAADANAANEGEKANIRDQESSLAMFPHVEITEEVEWSFEMLSLAMDLSGGKNPSGMTRPQLSYKKQLKDREFLANSVGSIPLLLKTILLLESNEARSKLFKTSIIRRIILSPESIGEWLTYMLVNRPIASRLAVDYFEVISNLSVLDFIGDFRKPTPPDKEAFRKARKVMYDEIFELGGTIPSLVVLDEKEIERAASTRAVYFVMSKSLTQPLVVALVVTDFVMQITLMLAYRSAIIMPELANLTEDLPISGKVVIVVICSYLLFRQTVDFIALSRVSRAVLLRHILDFWYLMDLSCILLTLIGSILGQQENLEDRSVGRGHLHAVTIGLLWVRLLTFLKIINERTATFILALVQIIRDSRFFLVVFSAVIFLFSDMLFIIFHSDKSLCEGEIPASNIDYCSDRPFNAYMRTYGIIMGNLAIEDYNVSPAVITVFLGITFFAFIILLNVLIAVISTSYDKASRKSVNLFRRARIEFVAGHTALESFVRPKKKRRKHKKLSMLLWVVQSAIGALIMLSMLGTTIVCQIYLVGSSWAIQEDDDALFFVIMYACLSVLLSLGVWGVSFFTFGSILRNILPTYAYCCVEKIDDWLHSVSKYAAYKVFGIHDIYGIDKTIDTGEDDLRKMGDDDDVAQLRWIRKELYKTEKYLAEQVRRSEDKLRRQLIRLEPGAPSAPGTPRRSSLHESFGQSIGNRSGRKSTLWG